MPHKSKIYSGATGLVRGDKLSPENLDMGFRNDMRSKNRCGDLKIAPLNKEISYKFSNFSPFSEQFKLFRIIHETIIHIFPFIFYQTALYGVIIYTEDEHDRYKQDKIQEENPGY